MKTSWNELRLIEDYLLADRAEDKVLFEARLILQPDLKASVHWQQKTYLMIHKYGRQQLRKEIEEVHQKLFTLPEHLSFRRKIMKIFGK